MGVRNVPGCRAPVYRYRESAYGAYRGVRYRFTGTEDIFDGSTERTKVSGTGIYRCRGLAYGAYRCRVSVYQYRGYFWSGYGTCRGLGYRYTGTGGIFGGRTERAEVSGTAIPVPRVFLVGV